MAAPKLERMSQSRHVCQDAARIIYLPQIAGEQFDLFALLPQLTFFAGGSFQESSMIEGAFSLGQ